MIRVALLLLLAAPTGAALLEDPSGDVQVLVQGSAVGEPPAPLYGGLDLRGLHITEDLEHIVFHVQFDVLKGDDGVSLLDSTTAFVDVRRGQLMYQVEAQWNHYATSAVDGGPAASGSLRFCDPSGTSCAFRPVTAEVDLDEGVLSVFVPRVLLEDEQAAYPLPGTVLTDLVVTSLNSFTDLPADFVRVFTSLIDGNGVETVRVRDRMPDSGAGEYMVVSGGGEVNGLSFHTIAPTRVSNGEATTLLFEPEVYNLQSEPVHLQFSAEGLPRQWDIWFPAQGVKLEPGANMSVPVLVSMPFAHAHGERYEFDVRARDAADANRYGTLTLGVQVTDIPQPAGHHNRLWLHGRSAALLPLVPEPIGHYSIGVWNTLEDDELDNGQAVTAQSEPTPTGGYAPMWQSYLGPRLAMGLQMDVAGVGQGEFTIESDRPVPATGLMGRVVHMDNQRTQTVLANITSTDAPQAIMPGAPVTFNAVVEPTGIKRVAYSPDSSLLMQLWLDDYADTDVAPLLLDDYAFSVRMQTGALLELPLLEYHDDVSDAYASVQQVQLTAATQERRVNPGETVVYHLDLWNNGPEGASFSLRLGGPHAGQGTLSTGAATLERGRSGAFQVALAAPSDALDGDVVDVFVEATRTDDAAVKAVMRLVARVDATADLPDESDAFEVQAPAKQSPVPVAVAILPLLAVLLARWRKMT